MVPITEEIVESEVTVLPKPNLLCAVTHSEAAARSIPGSSPTNACMCASTGRERLIRIRLIQSSTLFEVSVKSLPDSYHFMFKMHS